MSSVPGVNAPPVAGRCVPAPAGKAVVVRRLVALVILASTTVMLGLAAWLDPDPAGHGTHEQLNMPACSWTVNFDMPCPTCGMTTAFAHATEGDLLQSALTQPLGFLLAIATAMASLVSLYVLMTGSAVGSVFARLWTRWTIWALVALLIGSWGYKILDFKEVIG